jgi:hypothetical protein
MRHQTTGFLTFVFVPYPPQARAFNLVDRGKTAKDMAPVVQEILQGLLPEYKVG